MGQDLADSAYLCINIYQAPGAGACSWLGEGWGAGADAVGSQSPFLMRVLGGESTACPGILWREKTDVQRDRRRESLGIIQQADLVHPGKWGRRPKRQGYWRHCSLSSERPIPPGVFESCVLTAHTVGAYHHPPGVTSLPTQSRPVLPKCPGKGTCVPFTRSHSNGLSRSECLQSLLPLLWGELCLVQASSLFPPSSSNSFLRPCSRFPKTSPCYSLSPSARSVFPQESGPLLLITSSFSLTTGNANLGEPSRLATWGRGLVRSSARSPESHRHPAAASPHWHAGETYRWNQSSQLRAEPHCRDRGDKGSPAWGRGRLRVERTYFGAQCFLLKHG